MGGILRSSASPRPPCDGNPSASVWPSPRQTPCPPCPHLSDRTPQQPHCYRTPDATIKPVDAPSAWSCPSDLDKKKSDGREPPQGVAPHAHRGVIGAPRTKSLKIYFVFENIFFRKKGRQYLLSGNYRCFLIQIFSMFVF